MSLPSSSPLPVSKPEGAYRILHTADWHLGKLLNDRSREEEQTRFLTWLLSTVKENEVDAILVAGDIFDTANPPQSALGIYYNFVSALFRQGSCSLLIVAGNHDSAAHLEAPKQVLQALNAHVVGFLAEEPKARILCLPSEDEPKIVIAMMPFLRDRDLRLGSSGENFEDVRTQLVAGIHQRYYEAAEAVKELGAGCPAIATGHLTVLGSKTSESERDIHIGGLGAISTDSFPETFGYIALGHLHRPQTTDEAGRVRYSGSPIPLSFSEADDVKEVRILDVNDKSIVQHSLPIPLFRRLAQIRTTNAGLEAAMKEFNTQAGELGTWVEVVVEDATLQDELNERVRKLAERHGIDVLKVLRGASPTFMCMSAEDTTDDEAIETLLDKPTNVFEHLLKQHPDISEEHVGKLRVAFDHLVELETQMESVGAV